jgi:hypothetical protein
MPEGGGYKLPSLLTIIDLCVILQARSCGVRPFLAMLRDFFWSISSRLKLWRGLS